LQQPFPCANTTAKKFFNLAINQINFWNFILNNNSEIGQRYAKALFELSAESKSLDKIEKDLLSVHSLITKNNELNMLIKSSSLSRENQASLMEKLLKKMKVSPLIIKFIGTLAVNGRLNIINNIIEEFLKKLAHHRGELTAEITTAVPISKDINKSIVKEISKLTKINKIELKEKIDESLIGGLIIRMGSTMIDSSIKTKLSTLKLIMKGI
jgi:F-type H+-transporting ATPase subunit delta